jgi:hypothetical protein
LVLCITVSALESLLCQRKGAALPKLKTSLALEQSS